MKFILSFTFILVCFFQSEAQSFEGKLTYYVSNEISSENSFGITKEQIDEKMKEDGDFFDTVVIYIKDGNYTKTSNSENVLKVTYLAKDNKVYSFGNEYVTIIDANKYNLLNIEFKEPFVTTKDTSLKILNNDCTILDLDWKGMGSEQYYYNKSVLKIDSKLFDNHNYESLNLVLSKTKAYPLMIIKTLNKFMSIKMILLNIEEQSISEEIFQLPKLKKAKKATTDMMEAITGGKIMKYKK